MSIYRHFYGASTMSNYKDFAEISQCPGYVNLQRFYGAPTMSTYRDFAEISWCPHYVNLQRFYGGQFTEILHDKTKPVKYF